MSGPGSSKPDATALDREHRVQMRLLQALQEVIAAGSDGRDILAQLTSYSRAHFQSEELLMRLHAFAESDQHAAEHAKILGLLGDLVAPLERVAFLRPAGSMPGDERTGAIGEAAAAAETLQRVVLSHIGNRDSRLHAFLAAI